MHTSCVLQYVLACVKIPVPIKFSFRFTRSRWEQCDISSIQNDISLSLHKASENGCTNNMAPPTQSEGQIFLTLLRDWCQHELSCSKQIRHGLHFFYRESIHQFNIKKASSSILFHDFLLKQWSMTIYSIWNFLDWFLQYASGDSHAQSLISVFISTTCLQLQSYTVDITLEKSALPVLPYTSNSFKCFYSEWE